jgi:hypothetical protein
MQRVVIKRVANGSILEIGERVMRTSSFGFDARPEPTIEYGSPRVFKRGAKTASAWPKDAPAPQSVRSIHGNRSSCGDYVVAQFNPHKGYGGPEVIVLWNDLETLAQEFANSDVVSESEAAS